MRMKRSCLSVHRLVGCFTSLLNGICFGFCLCCSSECYVRIGSLQKYNCLRLSYLNCFRFLMACLMSDGMVTLCYCLPCAILMIMCQNRILKNVLLLSAFSCYSYLMAYLNKIEGLLLSCLRYYDCFFDFFG